MCNSSFIGVIHTRMDHGTSPVFDNGKLSPMPKDDSQSLGIKLLPAREQRPHLVHPPSNHRNALLSRCHNCCPLRWFLRVLSCRRSLGGGQTSGMCPSLSSPYPNPTERTRPHTHSPTQSVPKSTPPTRNISVATSASVLSLCPIGRS